jgi:hypothetical protein
MTSPAPSAGSAVPDRHSSVTGYNPPSTRTVHSTRSPLLLRVLDFDVSDINPAVCFDIYRDDDLSAQMATLPSPFQGGVRIYSYLMDLGPSAESVLSQHMETTFPDIGQVSVSRMMQPFCSLRDLLAIQKHWRYNESHERWNRNPWIKGYYTGATPFLPPSYTNLKAH